MNIPRGKHTYGPNPLILGHQRLLEGSEIGAFCSLGPDIKYTARGKHDMDWISTYPFGAFDKWGRRDVPLNSFGWTPEPIIIGNDVWTGANIRIKQNVTIGDGAVVAAESYVTGNVEPYSIVGGNPAKLIRYRFDANTIKELLKIKWWLWEDEKISKFIDLLNNNKDIEKFIKLANNEQH
jgi:acetyltransferase-like isoleucine patch superfamily enzyme